MSGLVLLRSGGAVLKAVTGLDWAKFWWLPLAFGGLLYLLIVKAELRHDAKVIAGQQAALGEAHIAAAQTAASLARAQAEIDTGNRRTAAAAATLAGARSEAEAGQARANVRWRANAADIARLQIDAHDLGRPACMVSDEAKKALEGL